MNPKLKIALVGVVAVGLAFGAWLFAHRSAQTEQTVYGDVAQSTRSTVTPGGNSTTAVNNDTEISELTPPGSLGAGLDAGKMQAAQTFATDATKLVVTQSPRDTQQGREAILGNLFAPGVPVPVRPIDDDDAAIGVLKVVSAELDSSDKNSVSFMVRVIVGGESIKVYKNSLEYFVTLVPDKTGLRDYAIGGFVQTLNTDLSPINAGVSQMPGETPAPVPPPAFIAPPAVVPDDVVLPPRGVNLQEPVDMTNPDAVAARIATVALSFDALTDSSGDAAARRAKPWVSPSLAANYTPFEVPLTNSQWSLLRSHRAYTVVTTRPYEDARDMPSDTDNRVVRAITTTTLALGDNGWVSKPRTNTAMVTLVKNTDGHWQAETVIFQ